MVSQHSGTYFGGPVIIGSNHDESATKGDSGEAIFPATRAAVTTPTQAPCF